jgi:hypothetical protein
MAVRLKSQSASQPQLLTSSKEMLSLPGYGAWLAPAKTNLSDARAQRVLAAQGLALACYACSGNVLPPALVKGFAATLKHVGHKAEEDWAALAESFPISAQEVRAWMLRSNAPVVRRMLVALEQVWAIPLVAPAALLDARDSRPTRTEYTTPSSSDPSAEDDRVEEDNADAPPPVSYLGWLVQRANYAGMRSHFGADGCWDALTVSELTHVCKAIRTALQSRTAESKFALLAVVCLCSSLPARLAIKLPLQPNDDISIAEHFAGLSWSLLRLLAGRPDKPLTVDELLPDHVMLTAFPADAAVLGESLVRADPAASDLAALLTGSSDGEVHRDFVVRYRAWLRNLGPGWTHAVYDARFAQSLSQIYRRRHGDVAAAWLSLDFREVALGMLHYIRLPRALLHTWSDEAYQEVGLGGAAGQSATGDVGSAVARSQEDFDAGWRSLQSTCTTLRAVLAACSSMAQAATICTDLNTARQAACVIAMLGRGNLLTRLSWPALYACSAVAMLLDKRIDAYSDLRGVPVHALLREQLDAHVEDLSLFAAACRRLGRQPHDRRGRDLSQPQSHGAAFFGVTFVEGDTPPTLRRLPISTSALDQVARAHFGQPINVGRHTLLTLAVREGWDPWWPKVLSGHHRGHAEPFADGGVVAPAHALECLGHALDRALSHLLHQHAPATSRAVLDIEQLCLPPSLPSAVAHARTPGSKTRLLLPAWMPFTPTALRICAHLRERLGWGEGPSHAGAEALLAGLLLNAIAIDDLRLIWGDTQALHGVGEQGGAVLWRRTPNGQELQRAISPIWAVALARALGTKGQLPGWMHCCEHAARWLRAALPHAGWPDDDSRCLRILQQLFDARQRIHVPPFLLSAAHPALGAAVPNRQSLARLACDTRAVDSADEPLLIQAAAPRPARRAPLRESLLSQVVKLVHRYGRTDLQLGEDDQRWQDLHAAVVDLDVLSDARAKAVMDVVRLDHDRWHAKHSDRIQVSSLSTYLYRITGDLDRIAPSEDLREWQEEWIDWFEAVGNATLGVDEGKRATLIEERLVAARHLLRGLRHNGYAVPAELLVPDGRPTATAPRRPASATVLLESDRERAAQLLGRHFSDAPLLAELASLYSALVFNGSLRNAEVGALSANALTPFDDLAVTSDGFSHLKSEHAWRLQHLPRDVAASFRASAALIQDAEPGARWMFLLADPNDWSTASTVSRAFGAALRQVTGDADARQHATRPLAPLTLLLPEWESTLALLVRGLASTQQCRQFVMAIQHQGVGRLVQALQVAGHGHPLTFLTHYFAIWPWVLDAFARADHANLGDASTLLRRRMPQARAAFRKARERANKAGLPFDGWTWLGRCALASMNLPALQVESRAPSAAGMPAPATKEAAPSQPACVLYLAARFMDLAPISAAHTFGLTTAAAASAEGHFIERTASSLRQRHQGNADGRGRAAELRLLRGEEGATLAARLTIVSASELVRLDEFLSVERSGPCPRPSIDDLAAEFLSCLTVLPQDCGLYVQTGVGKYDAADLARLARVGNRLFVGPPDRDLGNRPRVSVVDVKEPENRVRRARLTSLTRCTAHAARLIRKV